MNLSRFLLLSSLFSVSFYIHADNGSATKSNFERGIHADIAAIDKSFHELDVNDSGGIDANESKVSHALERDFSELQQYGDIDIEVYRQWLISEGDLGLNGEDWHR